MKTWMKTTVAASLIALAGVGTTAALARGGDCDGFGGQGGKTGMQRMAPEDRQERMSQRSELNLARLELALALQADQQPAWNQFKSAMSERVGKRTAQMQQRMQDESPATAVERLQRMEEMSKLRQAEMVETRKAVETFYATLSDAQKKVFDADFAKLGQGSGRGGHEMGPGRGDGPRGDGPRGDRDRS